MRIPPRGRMMSSRATVVWRPFPVTSLTSPVQSHSSPTSWLARVDLPTPAGADEGDGGAGGEVFLEDFESLSFGGGGDPDVGIGIEFADGGGGFFVLLGGEEVGFVDEDDGLGATFGDEGEISFEPAEVVVRAGVSNDDDEVHIGSDDLFLATFSGSLAGKATDSGQAGADDVLIVFGGSHLDGDPVTHGGQVGVGVGFVPDFSGEDDIDLRAIVKEGGVVDDCFSSEAGGLPIWFGNLLVFLFEKISPADVLRGHGQVGDSKIGGGSQAREVWEFMASRIG